MIVSSLAVSLSLIVLGLFYYFKDDGLFRQRYRYVPLASLTVYIAAFGLGIGPVPWIVMGEILSPRARGLSTGISTAFCFFCEFLITKEFQDLVHVFNFSGLFWIFALVTLVQIFFVYMCIPETKGKSLEDISQIFESGSTSASSTTALHPVDSLRGVTRLGTSLSTLSNSDQDEPLSTSVKGPGVVKELPGNGMPSCQRPHSEGDGSG